jgi:hypothetical protein
VCSSDLLVITKDDIDTVVTQLSEVLQA